MKKQRDYHVIITIYDIPDRTRRGLERMAVWFQKKADEMFEISQNPEKTKEYAKIFRMRLMK